MKILTVTHYFASNNYGVEIIADRIRRGLILKGHEVRWLAASAHNQVTYSHPQEEGEIGIPAWDFIRAKWDLAFPLFSPHHLPQIWREVSRCDIVHLHEAFYPLNQLVLWIAVMLRKPVVITQHIADMPVTGWLRGRAVALANGCLTRPAFMIAKRICFYSERTRAYFATWTSNKTSFIHNGCDHHLFRPLSTTERVQLRETLDLPRQKKLILFIGRFIEKKGLLKLESAVRAHPELHFLFIGEGPLDPLRWPVDNITILPPTNHKRLSQYYQVADQFVLPAIGEGMPLVIQEALCSGLEAIVSREIIEACPMIANWVVDAGPAGRDLDDKLTKSGRTVTDDRLRTARSNFARELWDWPRCIDAYEHMFLDVWSSKKGT